MDSVEKIKIFQVLKNIMVAYRDKLDCTQDSGDCFNLFTRHVMKNGKPLYFGGVKINKSYVSYHLMPIYVYPELVKDIPASIKPLLKGKSCFNLKKIDHEIKDALSRLTSECFTKYIANGYV